MPELELIYEMKRKIGYIPAMLKIHEYGFKRIDFKDLVTSKTILPVFRLFYLNCDIMCKFLFTSISN